MVFKQSALIGAVLFSGSVAAFPVCGFDVPENAPFSLRKEGGCSISLPAKKNYAGLDYLIFYTNEGIEKLLLDEEFFVHDEQKNFLLARKSTIRKRPSVFDARRPQSLSHSTCMTGYTANAEYFVQVLAPWNGCEAESYSLNVSCMFIAAGNQQKAFKRFCVPQNTAGKQLMSLYKSQIARIRP